MALRASIPRDLEIATGRRFEYRARLAWGGNHLRRRGPDGELVRKVSARSTAAGKSINTAIDGYRPHEDPLDPSYLSHWASTGRPLRPFQFDNALTSGWASVLFGDDATDVNGTLLKNHTAAPYNNTRDVWHDPSDRFQIQSNAIVRNGAPDATTYIEGGTDEYDLHFPLYVDNAGAYDAGVMVRYYDSSNYLYVRLHSNSSGQVEIVRVLGGASTQVAVDTSWTIGVGTYQMIVSVRRDRIKVYVDGVERLSYATRFFCLSTKFGPHCWSGCNPTWSSIYCFRPNQFWESFADWSNWTLATWGAATAQAASLSTLWGKLTVTSTGAGSDAGYSGVLTHPFLSKVPFLRDSVFQFQVGKNKPTHAGARFSEAGVCISNSSSNDISAETNCLIVCIRNSGTESPRIVFRKIVAGTPTDIYYQVLQNNEYAENVRVLISGGQLNIYTAKYGLVVAQAISHLNGLVHVKAYVRTDDTQAVNGYFRDVGVFPGRQVHVGGEVGVADSFNLVDSTQFALFGSTSVSRYTLGDEYALFVQNNGAWAWAAILQECGDFRWTGRMQRINSGNENCNLYFCVQDPSGDTSKCYVVTFNSTATYLGKDCNSGSAGPLTVLVTNAAVTTAQNEEFEFEVVRHGTRIMVWKNGVLVIDKTDASYSYGCFAVGGNDASNGGVMFLYEHEIAARGLQTPAMLRVDRPMIQNPSFEEWDDLDGLTEDAGTAPNSWRTYGSTSGAWGRGTDGSDGGYCAKLEVTDPQTDPYFQIEVWQRSVRILKGHKYRVSFRYRVTNTGGGLIGGYPFVYFKAMTYSAQEMCRHMIQIASPEENLVEFDKWLTAEFDFIPEYYWISNDRNYVTLQVSTEYPDESTFKPVGDFDVEFDQVLMEDVTGFGLGEEPELAWTDTPITFCGQEADREHPNDGSQAFYAMPLNIIWRAGDDFTWGLLDRDGEDLFTSRVLTNVLPGSLWVMRPEWIACDLGYELDVNQVLWYTLWSAGLRYLMLTWGGENFSRHEHLRIMDGLTVYSTAQRLFLELEEGITSRFVQVVVLDADEEGAIATAQQIELYNYADESARISNPDGGSPEVSINMTRPADKLNPLPDAATASVSLANHDQRFNPYNKYSPAYGPYKHFDGLGDIRAGVPMTISMIAARFIAGGDLRYAVRDECFGDQYWESGGWLDNSLNPGFIRLTPPSSPPTPYMVVAKSVTVNVDRYRNIQIGIERAHSPNPAGVNPNFVWRLGVLVGDDPGSPDETIYFPDDSWRQPTSWMVSGEMFYNEEPSLNDLDLVEAGLSGVKTLMPFVEFDFVGGFPVAYEFYVMIDHYYLFEVYEDREVEYETLMFMGSIGVDKNKGGGLGVSVDAVSGIATMDAVDFSVVLDQPVPVFELNPLETVSAEETMRKLCYLAGIPRQDTSFDETGITFPVVVFREQTFRENLQQLVQAIGGRFFASRDGRLRYQNVAINRSWTLSDRQEFESGIKSNVDTQSLPGEFWMDNVQWYVNHRFKERMPDQQLFWPWSVNGADSWRYLSNGDYVVITPGGQSTKMQHILTSANYDKSKTFTVEWDAAFIDQGGPLNLWGYVVGVAGWKTAACAWRVQIKKRYGSVDIYIGGKDNYSGTVEPYYWETVWAFPDNTDRLRCRIVFGPSSYAVYLNNRLHQTVPYCNPRQIRWFAYESESKYEDAFGAVGFINGRAGDVNTTGDVWHDASNRWRIDGYLHKVSSTEDWTTYMDFGCPQWWMTGDLYLDRTNAREGGWMVKYIDAGNWVAVRVRSEPDPYNGWQIYIYISVVARVGGGAVQTIANFSTVSNAYEGSQHFAITVDTGQIRVYMSRYNPTWLYYTLWFQVGSASFSYGTTFAGATKFAPYFHGGAQIGASWDNVKMDRGYGYLMTNGPAYGPWPLPGGGSISGSSSPKFNTFTGQWHPPAPDTYSAKMVLGLDAATYAYQQSPSSYPGWANSLMGPTTGYRLGYIVQKFNQATAPLNTGYNGVLTSPIKDLTANAAAWGVFEAEVTGIGLKRYGGLYEEVSNVDFYVQTSADGLSWSSWFKVVRGQPVPDTVPVARYFRWQARFWRTYDPWIAYGYPEFQYMRQNYFLPHVHSVTLNWQISVGITGEWFRASWNVRADNEADSSGVEMNAAQYSLGNPEANRVTALVNRWVEQSLTDYLVQAFWESSELPTILSLNETYVINAEYPYPSKKGSGGTLRHLHISVNSVMFSVSDGAGATVCGNATITFTSGQGVGIITILSNANGTSIDSAAIDAVCYKPASELYGTERVMAEDEEYQRMHGRIIETEPFDNAFSMSRAIAQDYADAELVRTKQYKETISGVQIPIMPSLSLESYGIVHNPAMGVYERQVEPMEISHQGFQSVVTGQGVRTQEETEDFDPLSLSPTGLWATHRLPGCASTHVMRVRSELTGEEFDVYDWQQWFPHYQLDSGEDWLDASDDDFRVVTLYDQTGNSRDFTQATDGFQPRLEIEQTFNGWPVVAFDGTDDVLQVSGHPISEHFTNTDGEMMVRSSIDEEFPTVSWGLLAIDTNAMVAILYIEAAGVKYAAAYNYDGDGDVAVTLAEREEYHVYGWAHGGGYVWGFWDGELYNIAASGATSNMTGELSIGNNESSRFTSAVTFSAGLADEDRSKVVGWMQSN